MFRTYVQHWKPRQESVHLIAGGAFAAGLEVARNSFYLHNEDVATAEAKGLQKLMEAYGTFESPFETAKTLDRMMGAFEFFLTAYPLGADGFEPATFPDGRRGIEFSFAEPLEIAHPLTNDPILYAGRCDMMGTFADGFFVEDDKTTTSLGASWSRQWEMRSQFTGYCWAAKRAGFNPQGALIRGVSILKTKFDTQQVVSYRADWELERWEDQLYRDVNRMLDAWRKDTWDYNLDNACGEYGGCSLLSICKSKDPEPWLASSMEQRVWDPLGRKELSVEEWEASWI